MLLSSWNTIRVSHGLFPIFQLAHCAIYFFLFKHRITKTNCARAVNIANNSADGACAHTINKNYAHYLRNTCRNIAVCDKKRSASIFIKSKCWQTNKQNRKQKDERDGNMSNKKYIHYYQSIVYNHTQRTKQSSIITDIQCVVQLERCD